MTAETKKLDIPEIIQIPSFRKILDDLETGNNVFLVGSAGTGKTTLAEKVAYVHAGRSEDDGEPPPFVVINCNQWTSPIDLKGGQTIEGYKEGGLIEAWRDGKILILDEMPKLDSNTAGILNDALAKSGKDKAIIFNGLNNPIVKHKKFGCIASGNVIGRGVSGNYVGNNKQDASLLDRFSGCIYRVGFNEALERQLIYPAVVNKCLEIRNAILRYEGKNSGDDDTEDIMTLRTMINIQRSYLQEMKREIANKKVPNGKTLRDAFESYFMVMSSDKAERIRDEINMEGFYNSYKGKVMMEEFQYEYNRRT
jgi:hypothetical protein